jgi:hypothetical protein
MKRILAGALAALTLGGALSATALPAAAADHNDRGWRGGYHGADYRGGGHYDRGWHGGRHGYGYSDAGAALLGLSVGAALAGGYAPAYYPPAYYAAPPCRIEMRWNPYSGGYDRVQVCY